MRRTLVAGLLALAVIGWAGCSSAPSYTSIDLGRDLSPQTLKRYESEWQQMRREGHSGDMATLEDTNWWPSGILLYYRRATVMRVEGPAGVKYHVMSGQGFGPLCLLYADSTHATYNAKGERQSGMGMSALLLGMLAMTHSSDSKLPDGTREDSASAHLLHHLFSYHEMDGHTYWSLLTIPNPLGFETCSGDMGQSGTGSTPLASSTTQSAPLPSSTAQSTALPSSTAQSAALRPAGRANAGTQGGRK